MSFCKQCGAQLPEGANVCPQCGNPVTASSAPQQAPSYQQAPAHPAAKPVISNKTLASVTKIFTFVMAGFAILTVLYGLITGIVNGARARSFAAFMMTFCSSFVTVATFVFFAIITAYINKKVSK